MRGISLAVAVTGLLLLSASSARSQTVAFAAIPGQFNDGVSLNVLPVVSADRRYVRMTLNPQFNALTGFDTISVPGAVGGGGINGGIGGIGGLGGLGGLGGGGGIGGGGGLGAGAGGVGGGFRNVGPGAVRVGNGMTMQSGFLGYGSAAGYGPASGYGYRASGAASGYDQARNAANSTMARATTRPAAPAAKPKAKKR